MQAPIERSTHVALRAAVLDLVRCETRRRFPSVLHAGGPVGGIAHVTSGAETSAGDAGLRADIALALLRRAAASAPSPRVWLTRPGALSVHDEDLLWLGPVAWAASALGQPTSLVVVTRRGWFDPVSGVSREWRRLRRQ